MAQEDVVPQRVAGSSNICLSASFYGYVGILNHLGRLCEQGKIIDDGVHVQISCPNSVCLYRCMGV
ncbi:hypothetical protein HBI56_200880 [Parastagonospora nodorum]|uniref:Uncharacterized protein n=1 Tax=Phaeosphaeria nodorum (strain SN15 / ATCC MYA-4574 / FGSC 10173) TaxID=321614 RepID=A0A7U2EW76_PHANO|nr:hypothetical protein HBH56_215430 [Parastagonospora nodorum]QRC93847.1 hypothetical protein JI435_404630 [Parastagonospora nodorum SN15]KAH3922535.1 hypothetical protein HBH54_222070 [Parastagonospora nodorum]KAH3942181.1 hypothetical protein HBH53_191980 [Parastagonospora nodorum]KAH3961259.1 hypothetical protein HBH51_184110 [Parastagonospora nodorum]